MRLLVSWIGNADLQAAEKEDNSDIGPVAQAIEARQFDRVLLLANQNKAALRKYEGWLRAKFITKARVQLSLEHVELTIGRADEHDRDRSGTSADRRARPLAGRADRRSGSWCCRGGRVGCRSPP
jgi:hypothetical protein